MNCGARRSGPYCGECGQRVVEERPTIRRMVVGSLALVFDLERGFLNTVVRLTRTPETVVHGYLAGRTVPYVHPVTYMLLAFAAFIFLGDLTGGAGLGDDRAFFALSVFFLAAVSRVAFFRAGLNYAEHLILNLFIAAHAILLLTLGHFGALLPTAAMRAVGSAAVAASILYIGWAYSRIFPARPVLAALGGLLVVAAGTTLWLGTLAAVFVAVRAVVP